MPVQVPQFLDIEDKIVGPLTLKQFSFLAAAFLLDLGLFYLFEFFLWALVAFTLSLLAIGLAFLKINGRGLPAVLISAFRFYWQPRLYLWQHTIVAPVKNFASQIKDIKDLPAPSFQTGPSVSGTSRPPAKPSGPVIIITRKPAIAAGRLTTGAGLKNLTEKMITAKNIISGREKSSWFFRRGETRYETLRKSTGERIAAKRVDYR